MHHWLKTTAPNGNKNIEVIITGIKKNKETHMPKYVRLEFHSYPMDASNLMTPAEARELAAYLIEVADYADEKGI